MLSKDIRASASQEWTPDFWQSWRETDNPYRSFKSQQDRRIAVELLSPRAGERILEVGCGYGWISRALWESADIHWIGVDASEGMVHHLRRDSQQPNANMAMLADATSLPFHDQSFDKVLCTGVLMHITDDHAALAEMIRVLRPGGRLLCSINNALSPFSLAARLWNCRKRGFVQRFRCPAAFRRRLGKAGLQVDSVTGDGVFASVSLVAGRFSLPPRFLFSLLRAVDRWVIARWPSLAYEVWFSAIRKTPQCAS